MGETGEGDGLGRRVMETGGGGDGWCWRRLGETGGGEGNETESVSEEENKK